MSAEKRTAHRKEISPLAISSISSTDSMAKIARTGLVVDASSSGFLLLVKREDLVPKALRQNLNLDALIGDEVKIYIEPMDLELVGKVVRTKLVGKTGFEIAVDFSDEAPLYWRECLYDLLPTPEEMGEDEW